EKDEPVYVPDAISHQRYKYFPETGEERFHTFLGVPVLDGRKKPLGVLVAQTLERRKFNKNEIRLLSTAANQVAQILSHFRLRESLVTKEKERLEYKRRMIEGNPPLQDYEKRSGQNTRAGGWRLSPSSRPTKKPPPSRAPRRPPRFAALAWRDFPHRRDL